MKVASNTPSSFHLHNGFEFVQLGDGLDDVSLIVLMLEKNWGSSSIDKIKALTHWISSYPQEIPCYVVGCESTIPNKSFKDYGHKERDDAVRAFCDEVLARSKSIGVRGEITCAYLTEVLGYRDDQVDIIYTLGADDNVEQLRRFLRKNNCPNAFEKNMLAFQDKPYVLYERAIGFERDITISKPYITTIDDAARLNADIRIDGQVKTLWCETNKIYGQFLLAERTDAFLCAILPFAMRVCKDIVCEAPVSEQFLHNLNEILVPQLCAHDPRLYKVKITAATDSSLLIRGNAVATGMSCGVDSFYTVSLYKDSIYKSMNLTHLYCGNYLYGNDGPIYERAEMVAQDLGLPLVRTATNINEALRLPHLYTHFFKTMFGVLSLKKLFRTYYYSTAEDFSHFGLKDNSIRDTAQFELLLLYTFSCVEFQVVTGGVKSERLEKTRSICALSTAQKFLNVCLYPAEKRNCGKCGKCMRTLLMLDMVNSLDRFQDVFDIEAYRKNRLDSFIYLVGLKNSAMFSEVYKYFSETDRLMIEQAEVAAEEANQ
ncbi:hypothetical protein [Massilia haematophila]|uniref:Uncharacterized protein n=1 Tax=Massilia haematophila TaxID=457923 RepID=A0ABV7PLC6_9BURK